MLVASRNTISKSIPGLDSASSDLAVTTINQVMVAMAIFEAELDNAKKRLEKLTNAD